MSPLTVTVQRVGCPKQSFKLEGVTTPADLLERLSSLDGCDLESFHVGT